MMATEVLEIYDVTTPDDWTANTGTKIAAVATSDDGTAYITSGATPLANTTQTFKVRTSAAIHDDANFNSFTLIIRTMREVALTTGGTVTVTGPNAGDVPTVFTAAAAYGSSTTNLGQIETVKADVDNITIAIKNNTNLRGIRCTLIQLVVDYDNPAPTPPLAPSGLTATTAGATAIDLVWTDNANNETGFIIDRKVGNGDWVVAYDSSSGANSTVFNDTGLTPSTLYTYRVRATNTYGDSANTSEASATTDATLVAGTASRYSRTQTQILVAWTAATGGYSTIATQLQQRAHGGGAFANIASQTTSPGTHGSLTASTYYDYRVKYSDSRTVLNQQIVYSDVITLGTHVSDAEVAMAQAAVVAGTIAAEF